MWIINKYIMHNLRQWLKFRPVISLYSEAVEIVQYFLASHNRQCKNARDSRKMWETEVWSAVMGLGELLFELAALWGMFRARLGSNTRNVKPDKTTRPYISERLKLIFSNNRSSWPLYTKLQIHTQISKCYNIWPQKIKDIILIPNVPTVQLNIFTFKVLHSKMKNIHVSHTTGLCESQTSFMILL